MSTLSVERAHTLFVYGMWWRITYGALRVLLGVWLLNVVHTPVYDLLWTLFRHELVEDPTNSVLYSVLHFSQMHPMSITYFAAFYFLFWGIVDIVLSLCLLRHQLFAFPFSLLLTLSFMGYEVVRFFITENLFLLLLLCVDSFVFWLIYREYGRLKARLTVTDTLSS